MAIEPFNTTVWLFDVMVSGTAVIVSVPASFLTNNLDSVPLVVFLAVATDLAQQAFTVLSLMMYLTLLQTPRPGISMLNLTN